MNDNLISIKGEVLSLISNSGQILGFSDPGAFHDYVKIITGYDGVYIANATSEKYMLDAILYKMHDENKVREILLDLLSQYRPKPKSEQHSLKHALIIPSCGIYKIFISILHFFPSPYINGNVRNESELILNCLININSNNYRERDIAYRRLSIDSDKIVSSICS